MRPATARAVLLIAAKDLRLRLRDHSALVTAFVAPIAIAMIMSTALGSIANHIHATLAVADDDRGPVAAAFVGVLRSPDLRPVVTPLVVGSPASAAAAVRARHADAAIVIPRGFSDRAAPGAPTLQVLADDGRPVGKGVARAVADGFMARVAATRLAVLTSGALAPAPLDPGAVSTIARAVAAASAAPAIDDRAPGRRVLPATYYGPAMGILFVFFLAGFGARSFLTERREGTMARLLAAPVPPGAIVAGKTLATFTLGITSLLVLYGVSTAVYGASWGDPLAVVALAVAIVAAMTAVAAWVCTLATTDEQAGGYTNMVTFVLGLLGGNFIQLYLLPRPLQLVSAFTPNGWALRGFVDLAVGGADVGSILGPLAVVTGFAAVAGLAAWRRAPGLVQV